MKGFRWVENMLLDDRGNLGRVYGESKDERARRQAIRDRCTAGPAMSECGDVDEGRAE